MGLGVDAVGVSQPMDLPPAHTVHHRWQGITIPGDARAPVWLGGEIGRYLGFLPLQEMQIPTSVKLKAFQVSP